MPCTPRAGARRCSSCTRAASAIRTHAAGPRLVAPSAVAARRPDVDGQEGAAGPPRARRDDGSGYREGLGEYVTASRRAVPRDSTASSCTRQRLPHRPVPQHEVQPARRPFGRQLGERIRFAVEGAKAWRRRSARTAWASASRRMASTNDLAPDARWTRSTSRSACPRFARDRLRCISSTWVRWARRKPKPALRKALREAFHGAFIPERRLRRREGRGGPGRRRRRLRDRRSLSASPLSIFGNGHPRERKT